MFFKLTRIVTFFLILLGALGVGYSYFILTHSSIHQSYSVLTVKPSLHPSPVPTQTIEQIFTYYPDPLKEVSQTNPHEYHLLATGDVIPARSVNNKMVTLKNFRYPFEKTAPVLQAAEILFINLESPLTSDCQPTIEGMIFCGKDTGIEGLTYAGVDVASTANNHAGNQGIEGINSTVHLLEKNNILVTGNGHAAIKTLKDKRVGFLGYNDIGAPEQGLSWADPQTIQKEVSELRKQVDFLIVTFHWGTEYKHDPDPAQVDLAHLTIDAGADVIIGNHPHWVQGVERYKGKFITYAHGNFVFDQMWSQETREGVLGQYIFSDEGLKKIQFFPIIIEDYSQPRFATEVEAKKILGDMKEASFLLQ